jgi:hypothetical protein
MLYLMSTTIIPAEAAGVWELTPVTLGAAQDLVRRHEFTSAVGHASTAEVMTELLGQSVEANRLTVVAKPDDHFLCFKLKQRPPEGAVLDRAQLEALGFDWCVMHYVEAREEGPPAEAYKIGSWDDFPGYIRWGQPPARRA